LTDEEWTANMPNHHLKEYQEFPHHDSLLDLEDEEVSQAQLDELAKEEMEMDKQGQQSLAQMNDIDEEQDQDQEIDNEDEGNDDDALNNANDDEDDEPQKNADADSSDDENEGNDKKEDKQDGEAKRIAAEAKKTMPKKGDKVEKPDQDDVQKPGKELKSHEDGSTKSGHADDVPSTKGVPRQKHSEENKAPVKKEKPATKGVHQIQAQTHKNEEIEEVIEENDDGDKDEDVDGDVEEDEGE
jgi:hypothetical protein